MTEANPRKWLALVVLCLAVSVNVLDNTVLTVAIPTIIRELHTNLRTVEWVISGYSLTYASLLIIGGRLGDLYGARRMFIIGVVLFGSGSLVASASQSVGQLIAGEAIIEGVGAALMMPATLAILNRMFGAGPDRAKAFAAWGAVVGAAAAFGPIVGGYLTTYHSWRWAFRLNVIVGVLAIIGALTLMNADEPTGKRERLDFVGAVLVAGGLFLLVFGIIESSWRVPAWIGGVVLLTLFVLVELRHSSPLFELALFKIKSFRYGVITVLVLFIGQLGMFFTIALFLQQGKHLTAMRNGLWTMPVGVAILIAAQLSGWLTNHMSTTKLVRIGLGIDALGFLVVSRSIHPTVGFWGLLPGLLLFGFGVGISSAQLTNVMLYEIPRQKSGIASGANATARQVGAALGAAIIGTMLDTLRRSRLHDGASRVSAIAGAARPTLLFAFVLVTGGFLLSFLIPKIDQRQPSPDLYDALEPVDTAPYRDQDPAQARR
jgi:EmrB/QacA subfamily drug resistance transporter